MKVINTIRDRKAGVAVQLAKFLRETDIFCEKVSNIHADPEMKNPQVMLDCLFNDIRHIRWCLANLVNSAYRDVEKCCECGKEK